MPVPTMRAAVYRRFGGPEVVAVEVVPRPEPGLREVRIRVMASTVSTADHRGRAFDVPRNLRLLARLTLGWRRPARPILGMDAAGIIDAVGAEVTAFRPGDEVIAMLGAAYGGHAEYVVMAASGAIAAKPPHLTFPEAAALVFGGITARAYLRQLEVTSGDRVLVNGASGAVGSAAVQLALAAGARVTGVASAANLPLITSLGAERAIDYASVDIAGEDERYDVILDCAGTADYRRVAGILAPGGRLGLVVADLRALLSPAPGGRRRGIRAIATPGPLIAADLAEVARLSESGDLRAVIERTYPLDDIVEAHRLVDAGRKRGAVVLVITE